MYQLIFRWSVELKLISWWIRKKVTWPVDTPFGKNITSLSPYFFLIIYLSFLLHWQYWTWPIQQAHADIQSIVRSEVSVLVPLQEAKIENLTQSRIFHQRTEKRVQMYFAAMFGFSFSLYKGKWFWKLILGKLTNTENFASVLCASPPAQLFYYEFETHQPTRQKMREDNE